VWTIVTVEVGEGCEKVAGERREREKITKGQLSWGNS
jgi:hypothetical protein